MQPDMFFEVLERIRPRISKQDTFWREAISAEMRLAIALRFFATGDSYMSLSYNWYVAHNTISLIVKEVAEAINAEYAEELICPPLTPDKWKEVADRFATRWNFKHTIGALDGKHVRIKCPKNSGSIYYNYKGFYSIVMLALVDADYKFIWLDVGSTGCNSDAQIWNSCELLEILQEQDPNKKIGLPQPEPIREGDRDVPYFIVSDDAFALRTYMMKPYSKRKMTKEEKIFNYRLSRARRIVENAFGILANRFRCILTTMGQEPKTVAGIVLACCCLHNLLRLNNPTLPLGAVDEEDAEHNVIPGEWRAGQQMEEDGQPIRARNTASKDAKALREYLKEYYSSQDGSVPWQDRMI